MASIRCWGGALKFLGLFVAIVFVLPYFAARTGIRQTWSELISRALGVTDETHDRSLIGRRSFNLDTASLVADSCPENHSRTHQNFQLAPPVPILGLSTEHILAVLDDSTVDAVNLAPNLSSKIHEHHVGVIGHRHIGHTHETPAMLSPLTKRGGAEHCSKGHPCPDGRYDTLVYWDICEWLIPHQ